MSARSVQGQGRTTFYKERGFAAAYAVSLGISRSQKVAHFPYWHCDLNAGCGWNEKARCDGSPIVFLRESMSRPNTHAWFCDKDPTLADALATHPLVIQRRAVVMNCDNKEVLPWLSAHICAVERRPEYAMGMVLGDPNGYVGPGLPHVEMIEFFRNHPRIDVGLNLNIYTYMSGWGHINRGTKGWSGKFWPHFSDLLHLFGKKHWLISRVMWGGGHGFVIAVGRNLPTDEHSAMGLYHLHSPIGQEIIRGIEREKADDRIAVEEGTNSLFALPHLSRVSASPGISRGSRSGDAAYRGTLHEMPSSGNRGPSQLVLPLGSL